MILNIHIRNTQKYKSQTCCIRKTKKNKKKKTYENIKITKFTKNTKYDLIVIVPPPTTMFCNHPQRMIKGAGHDSLCTCRFWGVWGTNQSHTDLRSTCPHLSPWRSKSNEHAWSGYGHRSLVFVSREARNNVSTIPMCVMRTQKNTVSIVFMHLLYL